MTLAKACVMVMATTFALAGASTAYADWRMPRHDAARTGAAQGQSNIQTPRPFWRLYLGGRVGGNQILTVAEGNEVVSYVAAAGRITKLNGNGQAAWRSEHRAITSVVTLADFRGVGSYQLAVASAQQAFIINVSDGSIWWEEPLGDMGTIGAIRAADFNGDGATELWVQECFCCQLNSGNTGFVYDFAAGFGATAVMAELPHAYCGGGYSLTIDDFDGNGALEGNLAGFDYWSMFTPSTNDVVATTEALSDWLGIAQCQPVVAPGQSSTLPPDLLCAHSTQLASAGLGHRVLRLAFVPEAGQTPAHMAVAWQYNAGEVDGGMALAPNAVLDLDGDGLDEIVVGGTLADGSVATYVLDAATGELLATIADVAVTALVAMRMEGIEPADPKQVPHALIAAQNGNTASFWRFSRGAAEPASLWLTLPNRRIATAINWRISARQAAAARPITYDITGDHLPELWMTDAVGSTMFVYQVADVPQNAPTVVASRSFGAARLGAISALHLTPTGELPAAQNSLPERLLVTTSDGYVHSLITVNLATRWRAEAGSYYDSGGWNHMPFAPVVGPLGLSAASETSSPPDAIVVPDSRGVLVAADASGALMVRPPQRLWELEESKSPALVSSDGSEPGVMCRQLDRSTTPATETVALIDRHGDRQWAASVGVGISVYGDALPARLNDDAIDDVLVQWGDRSDLRVRMTAFDGATGDVLWQYDVLGGENRNPAGFAAADYNGDGIDDAIIHHYGTRVINGVDGQELAVGGPLAMAYFMPMWTKLGTSATPSVVLQGGLHELRTLGADLGTRWVSTENDLPYPYAAVASCGDETTIAAGSLAERGRIALYRDSGAAAVNELRSPQLAWLAGGQAFATQQAMIEANALPGQLTSVHVHANLTGQGDPSALVGSTDGWLYAINPCTGAQQFAYDFGTAVGAIAFGDTDGDGNDEIIVSVADGYLYGLKHAAIEAPAVAFDLKPDIAPYGTDVDYLETVSTLAASWTAVEGAIRYQIAVADADGNFISAPAGSTHPNVDGWLNVATNNVVLENLPLINGANYRVAVRAIAASGAASPDVVSDGVLVNTDVDDPIDPDDTDPSEAVGAGGGCCQGSPLGEPRRTVLVALVAGAWLVGRRRAKNNSC